MIDQMHTMEQITPHIKFVINHATFIVMLLEDLEVGDLEV